MSTNAAKPRASALAIYRFTAGMSQAELARRAHLSRESIANLEAGKYQPRRLTADSIAAALGVEPEDLWPLNDDGRADDAAEVQATARTGRHDER